MEDSDGRQSGVHAIEPRQAPNDQGGVAEDAARFRALMRCGRIKMQGSSGVDPDTGERNGNNVHFGAEFWPEPLPDDYRSKYPAETATYDRNTRWGRAAIRALADAILEQEAALSIHPDAKSAPVVGEGDMASVAESAASPASGLTARAPHSQSEGEV